MALNKAALTASLTAIFSDLTGKTPAVKAGEVADAIDAFVRTGSVSTVVTVASVSGVTVGAGVSGPGTGTGTGAIT